MHASWVKWLLWLAAAWNLLGGASALVDPDQHFQQLYNAGLSLADPLQLFFYRCTWINVMAWGLAYALAARMVSTRSAVLIAGGCGKSAYFLACYSLYLSGIGKTALLAAGLVDVCFAVLFFVALWRLRR